MYDSTEKYYDKLYSFKNFKEESQQITDCLKKHHPDAKTVLDIGCGTGEHIRFLKKVFLVEGIDLNKEFVRIASEKNPDCIIHTEDMTEFDTGRHYDVVLCLFGSIGYVKTIDRLKHVFSRFKKHLNKDGVIIVEPFMDPGNWKPGKTGMLTYEWDDLNICRMHITRQKEKLAVLDFQYLVSEDGEIKHLHEIHELGLFSDKEIKNAFESTGLTVEFEMPGITGRGLYIARAD